MLCLNAGAVGIGTIGGYKDWGNYKINIGKSALETMKHFTYLYLNLILKVNRN